MAPPGRETRPTADRARQALFDVLDHASWTPPLTGAHIVDLFAGSGALGLEALSRGAAHGLFVDAAAPAIAAVRANLEALGLAARADILRLDATRLPAHRGQPCAFAFLDPPYGAGLVEPALEALRRGAWIDKASIVIAERAAAEPPLAVPGYDLIDTRAWGAAQVSFLRLAGG